MAFRAHVFIVHFFFKPHSAGITVSCVKVTAWIAAVISPLNKISCFHFIKYHVILHTNPRPPLIFFFNETLKFIYIVIGILYNSLNVKLRTFIKRIVKISIVSRQMTVLMVHWCIKVDKSSQAVNWQRLYSSVFLIAVIPCAFMHFIV